MKNLYLSVLFVLGLINLCNAAPSNSMSQQYTPNPNATISSSSYNAEESHQATTYNAHTHTDITQTGVITSGTWQGTSIDEAYGGLGSDFSSTAQGNILYFSGTGTITSLAPSTANYPLVTNGAGANPAYEQLATVGIADLAVTNAKIAASTIDLTAKVTGTLPVTNGGTGTTKLQHGVVTVNGSSSATVTLSPTFATTTYTVTTGWIRADASNNGDAPVVTDRATNQFVIRNSNAGANDCGYIAIE